MMDFDLGVKIQPQLLTQRISLSFIFFNVLILCSGKKDMITDLQYAWPTFSKFIMAQPNPHSHSSVSSWTNRDTFQMCLMYWLHFCPANAVPRFLNHKHYFLFNLGFCLPVNSSFHRDKASSTGCKWEEALGGWFPARTGGVSPHCICISRRYGHICNTEDCRPPSAKGREEGETQINLEFSKLFLHCIWLNGFVFQIKNSVFF